jgi:hypothetical protein
MKEMTLSLTDTFSEQGQHSLLRIAKKEGGGEPSGPANRSQPVGPETNRTPSAAGSGG